MIKRKQNAGFTIVELLIVIVVIAILAAITITAYNGIQNRAREAKTTSAVIAYVKALQLYYADHGSYPAANSCFGTSTTYPGNNQCWTSATWKVTSAFKTLLQPYMTSLPEPDITNIGTDASPRRGAFYYSTQKQIYAMYAGADTCPTIGGITIKTSQPYNVNTTGIYCIYQLP